MRNAKLDEAQARIKIAGRNINNLRYADDTKRVAWICVENILLMLGLVVESALQKFPRKTRSVVLFWIN